MYRSSGFGTSGALFTGFEMDVSVCLCWCLAQVEHSESQNPKFKMLPIPELHECQRNATSGKSYTVTKLLKILYKVTSRNVHKVHTKNEFAFRLESHPRDISLWTCKDSKIQKNLKSETLLVLSISDKGHWTCTFNLSVTTLAWSTEELPSGMCVGHLWDHLGKCAHLKLLLVRTLREQSASINYCKNNFNGHIEMKKRILRFYFKDITDFLSFFFFL